MYKDLEGKVALITGAGDREGIGFGIARALARDGMEVVFADLPGMDAAGCCRTLRNSSRRPSSSARPRALSHRLRAVSVRSRSRRGSGGLWDHYTIFSENVFIICVKLRC